MKKLNDLDPMNADEFEKQLQRQPLRPVPAVWRDEILAAAKSAEAAPPEPRTSRPAPSFLSALLWPCPQAWAGLAAVWLAIFAINSFSSEAPQSMAQAAPPSPEIIRVVQEQRRQLAQLIEPRDPPPAEPPKPFIPRPRGEIRPAIIYV